MSRNKTARFAIVGAGGRGSTYASIAAGLSNAEVVAVAEPRALRLAAVADECGVPEEMRFTDWRDLLDARPVADMVVVSTQDTDHAEPAIAFMEQGYDVLVEKPMAPTRADAERMVLAAERTGRRLIVAHVLRYQRYTKKLLELIGSGAIGDVVVLDHLEPIGDQHFAHSYVRGNWRNESVSSSALMSKSCHDIDWMAAIVGAPAARVSSFGSLYYFRRENAPDGSGERCLDCAVETSCAFSAKRQYLTQFRAEGWQWPVAVIAEEATEAAIIEALETGPYGRCVYRCDNDVVDHQVVNIEFASGQTASFTMSAFTQMGHRRSRIGGTRGFLEGNGETIDHFDYLTRQVATYDTRGEGASAAQGHGGGDQGLITDVVEAVLEGDWSVVPTDARESLDTHSIVWAAEEARNSNTVVSLNA